MFGLMNNHTLVYRDRYDAGGDAVAFVFSPERGALKARAGQHMVVAATTTLRKPFSIASAPEEEFLIIGTSLRSGSAFKSKLASLSAGEKISARGPVYTYFKPFGVAADPTRRAVMLAQGLGVTPFRSMLAHLDLTQQQRSTHLIHVAGHGHPFRNDTTRWAQKATYVEHSEEFKEALADEVEDDATSLFYVAGAPAFTAATMAYLRSLGIPRHRIRDDPYLFYKPTPA